MKEEGLKVEEEKEKECLYRRGSGGKQRQSNLLLIRIGLINLSQSPLI